MISTLFASSKFVTNRNHFHVIAETGPTGQLQSLRRHGKWRPPLPSREQRRIGLFGTCRSCNALLCPRVNHLNDTEYNHSLPPYSSALIHVSSHLYVASNELRYPGVRPKFRFPNAIYFSPMGLTRHRYVIRVNYKIHRFRRDKRDKNIMRRHLRSANQYRNFGYGTVNSDRKLTCHVKMFRLKST